VRACWLGIWGSRAHADSYQKRLAVTVFEDGVGGEDVKGARAWGGRGVCVCVCYGGAVVITEKDRRPGYVQNGVGSKDVEGARLGERRRAEGARAGETDDSVESGPHLIQQREGGCEAATRGREGGCEGMRGREGGV
jgi:hypothetical protein